MSPTLGAYSVWSRCTTRAAACLAELWQDFDCRQGDVNATYVRPYARRRGTAIKLYKGESFTRFSPLREQSATAVYAPEEPPDGTGRRLRELATLRSDELGVALREVARLNTRERLQVTFFRRGPGGAFAFDHTVWRVSGNHVNGTELLAVLGVLSSRLVAYLLNLFSASNHASLVDIGELPAPPIQSLPMAELAAKVTRCLKTRRDLEAQFVERLGVAFPDHDGDGVPSPDLVLSDSGLPSVRVRDAEMRGDLALSRRPGSPMQRLTITGNTEFQDAVRLIVAHADTADRTQIRQLRIPDPDVAQEFVARYRALEEEARVAWRSFEEQQAQVDQVVFDWYGLSETLRAEVRRGLPWARRVDVGRA